MAVAFIIFYALALSLAEATRFHSATLRIQAGYLLPLGGWLVGIALIQRTLHRNLPNRDIWIFPIVALLIGLGLLTIWSLSADLGFKQVIWFLIGSLIFVLAAGTRDLTLTLKR